MSLSTWQRFSLSLSVIPVLLLIWLLLKVLYAIAVGVPSYNSLEVHTGMLLTTGTCKHVYKQGSYLPVEVRGPTSQAMLRLPCTPELRSVPNGTPVEIRTRDIPVWFRGHIAKEVWSVRVEGTEVFSYSARSSRAGRLLYVNYALVAFLVWVLYRFSAKIKKSYWPQ